MRKDLIHIHINKTAGTSIRSALFLHGHPRHLTAIEWRQRLPCCYDDAFVFAFVRHPLARVVSSYEYKWRMGYEGIRQCGVSFDRWVRAVYRDRAGAMFTNGGRYFQTCAWWLSDEQGRLIVDNIYRFEDFGAEVERLKEDLRARGVVVADFTVPHLKVNPSPKPLEEYYSDPETLAIITDFFAVDFATFGYETNNLSAKKLTPETT